MSQFIPAVPRQDEGKPRLFKPSARLLAGWPEVFEKRLLPRDARSRYDDQTEAETVVFLDPGADQPGTDLFESYAWASLLADAFEIDFELAVTLHGFRCMGCRLLWTDKGLVIKPGQRFGAFESEEDYKKARETYLLPYREQLTRLLKKLAAQLRRPGE
jgi:hypothetical protein